MKTVVLLLSLLCLSLSSAFADGLTERQRTLLRIAYEEGHKVGFPETIQAILFTETTAGLTGPVGDINNGFGNRSYCPMQLKLDTVKWVMRYYDDLGRYRTDEELLVRLLTDDQFCIKVAARNFTLIRARTDTWKEAVLSYNRGLTGALNKQDPLNYVEKVSTYLTGHVRPFNRRDATIHAIAQR